MAGSIAHSLVPFHEVLSDEEAALALEPYGIVNGDGMVRISALPPIPMDDPALLGACVPRPSGVSADWPLDKVVRIERRSVFAGISIAYRVVSSVSAFPHPGRPRSDQLGLANVKEAGLVVDTFDEGDLEAFDIEQDIDTDDLIFVGESNDYDGMKVNQLKDLLKERGLPVSGRKADLIQRLEESD